MKPPILRRKALYRLHHVPNLTRSFWGRKGDEPVESLIPQISEEWHRGVEQHPDLHRDPPKSVAILGAGVTGLTAAYQLAHFSPETSITILEASPRTGGWIQSLKIPTSKGSIIFETGPRTLRPWTVNGIITLNLISHLNLQSQILSIPKTSPAAKNRYIYFDKRLNELPSSVQGAFQALRLPVLKGAIPSILTEIFRRRRPKDVEDESVESFLTRRLGANLTNNLASAVFHGIYAGDIANLSADALLHAVYRNERVYGSITRGMLGVQEMVLEDKLLEGVYGSRTAGLLNDLKKTSIYSFKGGMEVLTKRMEEAVTEECDVTLKTGVKVNGLRYNQDKDEVEVLGHDSPRNSFDFVISTLPAWSTASLLPPDTSDTLFETTGVNVMVVNLFYDKPNMTGYSGFGYLIPKSVPLEQNPHRALGVIFDSDAMPSQDERQGTKVTVMLGGHWWSNNATPLPSQEDGVRMAREVLSQHLGITAEPAETMASLQMDCIPQYGVGHAGRLRQVHEDLMDKMGGKLVLAGSSYGGVGLNDCVRSARDAAFGVAAGRPMTNLERWAFEEVWIPKDMP
ncbi:oxygen-dependent protoporphyrinogen oxidase [Orbilia blumenaviensis]|uniref:Protoporphyrinogen oxidase n=1 Tax=Orbilia blumenaviensis TaxID=1796055 RepID=A0AAV9VC24_9PEZI